MSHYYDINGCAISQEAALPLFESKDRIIGNTDVGDATVSTVHLVIDHSFGSGPPIIFETMIFGGRYDECQWRYATRAEAEAGHERVVEALRAGEAP